MQQARRARRLYAVAVLLALLAVACVAGAIQAADSGRGPAATVTAYFRALAAGDAAAALGLGVAPPSGEFLTRQVLQAQNTVAPIDDLQIQTVDRHGGEALAKITYRLGFKAAAVSVSDQVRLTRHGRDWRLVSVAVRARLQVAGAAGRLTLAGRPVPAAVELFPGALPLGSDWAGVAADNRPYLRLQQSDMKVTVEAALTVTGKAEIGDAVQAALERCLTSQLSDPRCPTADGTRSVPASLRGTVTSPVVDDSPAITIGAAGLIRVQVKVPVRGTCKVWDFDNIAVERSGDFTATIRATVSVGDRSTVYFGTPA